MEARRPENGMLARWFHVTSYSHPPASEAAGAQLMGARRVPDARSSAGRSPPFHSMAADITFLPTVRTGVTNDESLSHSECVENQVSCITVSAYPLLEQQ